MVRLVLGLGSNVGDGRQAFSDCLAALAAEGQVIASSRMWRTRPVGPSQPDFLNAAALIDWPAGLRPLLERCRQLEAAAGRDRTREEHWGPRTLDLDLLIAASAVCRGPELDLPHPRMHQRRFALEPAAELVPDWVHPFLGLTIEELVEKARRREPDAVISTEPFKR